MMDAKPTITIHADGQVTRTVDPRLAIAISEFIQDAGGLTEEAAMRLLYPEEAARIYDLDHHR